VIMRTEAMTLTATYPCAAVSETYKRRPVCCFSDALS
jgi:hypothetical protein